MNENEKAINITRLKALWDSKNAEFTLGKRCMCRGRDQTAKGKTSLPKETYITKRHMISHRKKEKSIRGLYY